MTVNNLMFGSYGVSTGKTIQYVHRYLGFTVRLVRELE